MIFLSLCSIGQGRPLKSSLSTVQKEKKEESKKYGVRRRQNVLGGKLSKRISPGHRWKKEKKNGASRGGGVGVK